MAIPNIITVPHADSPAADDKWDLFQEAEALGFGDLHLRTHRPTRLRALVAIHSTRLGPAFGGCRCVPYVSTAAALQDAMRLAQSMSYKNALAHLPYGGGKAVLMQPPQIKDREAYFEAFGRFVHDLGGRYVTAVDSGTSVADMDIVARQTPHVLCTSSHRGGSGDPSPYTALGVRLGIQAAVAYKLKRSELEGIRIAIQGVGHVGYHLAKELRALGAHLSVCDLNSEAVQRCADEFNAQIVPPERIYTLAGHVFSPCALGGILNDHTLPCLQVPIIAGGANNQLLTPRHGQALQAQGILYAPDYVINAGGAIHAAIEDEAELKAKIEAIYATLIDIFHRSEHDHQAPNEIADGMAEEIFCAGGEP